MKTTTTIDITMKQLHQFFEKYQIANPTITDAEEVISSAIGARWPGSDVDDVLHAAEVNWINESRKDMVRAASRDMSKWIDTVAQGDLFDNWPVKVPKWFMIDGEPREYWRVSIVDGIPYVQVRVETLLAEASALKQAMEEKDSMAKSAQRQLKNMQRLIRIAEENGIDPNTVKYAKKD